LRFLYPLILAATLASAGHAQAASSATSPESRPEPRVSFRVPPRQYQKVSSALSIYVERSLAEGDKALSANALRKLERSLHEIFALLPKEPGAKLKGIRFYLMWGERAPEGGHGSGMAYFRVGEPQNYPLLDPTWNHVIVVYSAENLMYLDSLWTKKALMHELAHAWHIYNWPERYAPINTAFLAARAGGLYLNVRDNKGKFIPKAYAITNQLEYFAEVSAMYFVGGNYFPFDRAGLARYDGAGERMVRRLWGLQ
jgi:hypothetical protein